MAAMDGERIHPRSTSVCRPVASRAWSPGPADRTRLRLRSARSLEKGRPGPRDHRVRPDRRALQDRQDQQDRWDRRVPLVPRVNKDRRVPQGQPDRQDRWDRWDPWD